MNKDIIRLIKEKVNSLPNLPGVYKMYDIYGNVIYIGKAKNLKNRVSSYFVNTAKLAKVQQMVDKVYDFEYIITPSELEALNLESNLIHTHQPFYNILLKDGKAFAYIKIDYKNTYPKIAITRKLLNDKALYFGPYINKISASALYKIINNTFKLRDCNINMNKKCSRACLNYHIGNCLAPCIRNCSPSDYRLEVDKVVDFLKGDTNYAKDILVSKMKAYVEMEMFEKAIELRDNLKALDYIDAQNVAGLNKNTDIDIFGIADNGFTSAVTVLCIRGNKMVGVSNYSVVDASLDLDDTMLNFVTQYYMVNKIIPKNIVVANAGQLLSSWLDANANRKVNIYSGGRGIYLRLLQMANANASEYLDKSIEKNKQHELKTLGALASLEKLLGLSRLPKRIEGYDISNLSGTNTVASMVVFVNGQPSKKMYRKFKIADVGKNDFRNMRDILDRRLAELKKGKDISFAQKPDLILIDGGIIQLNFAKESLDRHGIECDIISLAKRQEEIFKSDGSKIILGEDNYALKLLQNVRDESHRFAITFQKSLREKNALKSELEKIPLVGKTKINALFDHFKSIDNIQKATVDQLQRVNGIGRLIANEIYNYFHK